ncbi:MAG: TonB-dependent receptor plug domain-containing protein [Methylomicrobium sp.]
MNADLLIDHLKVTLSHCLPAIVLCVSPQLHAEERNDAFDLSVEDLLNAKVTSVAKKAQSLNDAPAAIFVISNEDIKRSGVTSIPEALRLAPGLDVARIDANKWAVSARGFHGRFANKLLVLIDGRNAYTRTFSGVYWENQDVMLEDVDRIEVIRGPGATLWGANAVNGVINIITKHSSETQGMLLNAGGGTEERGFGSFRYGAKLGEDTTARVYAKGFYRDENTHLSGGEAGDDWNQVQGGFRLDSHLSTQDALTVQGDVYQANINQFSRYPQIVPPFQVVEKDDNTAYGGNLLARWQHTVSPTSDYALQFYYNTYTRNEVPLLDHRDTLDLDFQHRFALLDRHEIVWGLNYRFGDDRIEGTPIQNGTSIYKIDPGTVHDQVYSGFIQDEMTLIDNTLWLTIGSKFEHNDYSGFEGQPSARLMWAPHHQHRLWAGVSRAVRTPSRAEQDASILGGVVAFPQLGLGNTPLLISLQGNPNFRSEEVITYETGYRTTFAKSVSLDITGFYNDYRDLASAMIGTPSFNGTFLEVPFIFNNGLSLKTYGVEIATVWQMLDWWRWDINYSWLHTQLQNSIFGQNSRSPEQKASLRGVLSPWENIDLDFWFRYVDTNFESSTSSAKDYVTLDLRVAWRPIKQVELALVGQNLLAQKHLETNSGSNTLPTAIDRGMYGKISWNY